METASRSAFEAEPFPEAADSHRPAPSEELDALFRLLVERAHEAVDRLAEQAAPAVSQLSAGLALFSEAAGGAYRLGAEQADDSPGELGDTHSPLAAFSPGQIAEQYVSLVREHPVASLAAAIAAGIVLGQTRAR